MAGIIVLACHVQEPLTKEYDELLNALCTRYNLSPDNVKEMYPDLKDIEDKLKRVRKLCYYRDQILKDPISTMTKHDMITLQNCNDQIRQLEKELRNNLSNFRTLAGFDTYQEYVKN